ncbi:MAG: haloacid dehalogenase type II [Comamonadaceae bacterium]|nr:haloacid dehalogenase type II [Comamonadaceae bacterium]
MEKPRAVLFDAYGTLFDVYSVGLLAEQLFPGQGARLATVWRDKQIEYTRLVTTCDHGAPDQPHYRPFWVITQNALAYAIKLIEPAARSDWPAFEGKATQLMNQYRHLSAFPENREVLQALRERGIATGILSNGEPEMLGIAVRSAGLEGLLDHLISVDSVRKYKTHPDAYAQGEKVTGLTRQQIVFVSSNAWDALGATWFGYRTLWVNRQNLPFEELGTLPTRTATNLREVLSWFD